MSAPAHWLVAAWYRGSWWLWLLRPAELLFRLLAALRRACYRQGFFRAYRSPVPVVVVGNITVGGTGKTPVVIALVEALAVAGLRAGVVSRGYGATRKVFPHVVSEDSSAADCGDEPLMVYRRTGCPCVVSPDRAQAARTLLSLYNVDILLSDDGLQHYGLARDLEIVLLDAERLLGNGFCLPAGPLREPACRLDTVDYTLYRGGDIAESAVRSVPNGLVRLANGERLQPGSEQIGAQVDAVAGIGQPAQFFNTLRNLGFAPREHAFPDHHLFSPADFSELRDRPVIMTEKDAVKCGRFAGADAWYLSISAHLPQSVVNAVIQLAER